MTNLPASYDLLCSARIRRVSLSDGCGPDSIVGNLGVKKIEVAMENGQCARVPWFAVYGADDALICMVNAAHVQQVDFYPPTPEATPEQPKEAP